VAYFLITSLTAEERATITKKVIEFVASSGVQVIGLTFDGLAANIKMCQKLNADVFNNRAFFEHPEGSHMFIFLDAAHMLKLIRNTFASKYTLYDANNNEINFAFIENLINLQKVGNFHLANKVNNKHLQWKKIK